MVEKRDYKKPIFLIFLNFLTKTLNGLKFMADTAVYI